MIASHLFQAGLVAASAQLITAELTTFIALEFLQHNTQISFYLPDNARGANSALRR